MARTIPENAFLFKENLYIVETVITMGSMTRIKWEVYTPEDYCFYDLDDECNYDEEGNLRPETERMYYQYMITVKNEERFRDRIIVVPVQEGFEIANTGNNHETA